MAPRAEAVCVSESVEVGGIADTGSLPTEFYAGEDEGLRRGRNREARMVTVWGALVDLGLTIIKLLGGFLAGSVALIADGIHSLSDLAGDIIVWSAYLAGGKEADEDHPYGHQRYQTIAALVVAGLIIATAIGVMWDAIDRLDHSAWSTPHGGALAIAGLAIVAKEGLYRWTRAVGRRLHDPLLEGNAVHHRSDALSSIAALIGIGGALAGAVALDLVAAIVVGLLLLRAGWQVGREALSEIAEGAADPAIEARISTVIATQPDVDEVHLLKTRRMGGDVFVDVHVQVPPRISVTAGHQVAERVRRAVIEEVHQVSDVLVHVDPEDDEAGSLLYPPRPEMAVLVEQVLADMPEVISWDPPRFHLLLGGAEVGLTVRPAEELDVAGLQALSHEVRRRVHEAAELARVEVRIDLIGADGESE